MPVASQQWFAPVLQICEHEIVSKVEPLLKSWVAVTEQHQILYLMYCVVEH